ncbi:MAG TPA: hydroxymethylbilane synthase, partial [Phycisphaerae bacterium]|nr:hydroxymethylbilane synthase [Phycisphaerae bacterium]
MNPIVIGTRGSELAMRQAGLIRDALAAEHPGLEVTLRVVHTTGDRDLRSPAQQTSGKGMFTTEIEAELLSGSISLAVHSMKDLPTRLPDGLVVGAVTRREDPADVLVSSSGCVLADLPRRAKVLTGSPRRRALLLHRRPDLRVLPVRGNVPTRLRKLEESGADAVVLARAGLVRLGLSDRVTERLDPAEFVPACGQGALAVEIRQSDDELLRLVRAVDDPESRYAVAAERVCLA